MGPETLVPLFLLKCCCSSSSSPPSSPSFSFNSYSSSHCFIIILFFCAICVETKTHLTTQYDINKYQCTMCSHTDGPIASQLLYNRAENDIVSLLCAVRTQSVWNQLPTDSKLVRSAVSFKHLIMRFFFRVAVFRLHITRGFVFV